MPSSAADIQLTPTARLARQLARQQAIDANTNGQTAWLPTTVTTFNGWLQQLRQDYLLLGEDERVPISSQQAQVLWQSVIDHEVFVGEPQVANLAQQAWRTVHEFALPLPQTWDELLLSEDSRRLQAWSDAYRKLCAEGGWIDEWMFAAALPELISHGELTIPGHIELVGFDLPLTPLQRNILAACESAGSDVDHQPGTPGAAGILPVLECVTDDDELLAAAQWARGLIQQDPQCSIAVVVPDLAGRVDSAERIFRQVFDPPGYTLYTQEREAWHISLGKPLSRWPLVSAALAALTLNTHRISQPQVHQLLRSPFLHGAQMQAQACEHTLSALLQHAPYALTLAELQWALRDQHAALLADALEQWLSCRQQSSHHMSASAWAGQFQAELSSLGYAKGRGLDSREYQTLNRWHDVLEAFSALDLVTNGPLSRQQALTLLRDRANSTVFRERNPGAPVEILGVEEALGSRFDAVWITSLDNDTWPGPTRRDALIPGTLQTSVPRANSEACLARAALELELLQHQAPRVHGSFARGHEEVAAQMTALIERCHIQPMTPLTDPVPAPLAAPLEDFQAPAMSSTRAAGGTSVLRHQSGCPFRAFAEHRLGADQQLPPRPGLNAGQRGTITHKALEHFFRDISDSDALAAIDPAAQSSLVQQAVTAALDDFSRSYRLSLSPAGRVLEQRRTERVLARWLALERQRSSFRIKAHEQRIDLSISNLKLRGSIDRLDELADGSTLLIDYKTGRSAKSDWYPQARLVDPQLPAYAVNLRPPPQAITFAHLRPEQLRFEGLSDHDIQTPGISKLEDEGHKYRTHDSWPQLLTEWQTHIGNLGEAFVAGYAAVDPRTPNECSRCHLQSVCRVLERAPYDSLNQEQDFA